MVETYLSEKIGDSQSTNSPVEVNIEAAFAFMGIAMSYVCLHGECGTCTHMEYSKQTIDQQ